MEKPTGVAQIIPKSPPLSPRSGSIFPCEEPKALLWLCDLSPKAYSCEKGCVHSVCVGSLKTGNLLGHCAEMSSVWGLFLQITPPPGLSSHTVSVSVECLFVLLARVVQPSSPDIILQGSLHFTGVRLVPSGKHWLLMWTGLPLLAKLSLIPEFCYLCFAPGLTLFFF